MKNGGKAGRAWIVFELDGKRVERELAPKGSILGRDGLTCDICFPPSVSGVSRQHAVISFQNGQWLVTEPKPTRNGTFLNGLKIDSAVPRPLTHGDTLTLGEYNVRFSTEPGSTLVAQLDIDRPGANVAGSISFEAVRRTLGFGTDVVVPRPSSPEPTSLSWLALFEEVGRALLSSHDVTAMLERILDLAFSIVPSGRGAVFLTDSGSSEDLVPVCMRTPDGQHRPVKVSRTIMSQAINSKSALLIEDTHSNLHLAMQPSIQQQQIGSAICVPMYDGQRLTGLIYVDAREGGTGFREIHLTLLAALALFSGVALEQARLREDALREQKARERLARYSSPTVVDLIVKGSPASDELLVEEREISVLFADLRGFTALSERIAPRNVVAILNSIFERFTSAVFQNGGTLDKFMGDGMLAFFGAPLPLHDHAVSAVRAALEIQHAIDVHNASVAEADRLAVRIGINSGSAVIGDIGSTNRRDYTVIGDTVNVASRLESGVARPGQIIIGPRTYAAIGSEFACQPLEPVVLKGRIEPIQPYLVSVTHKS